jgi:hypothetical protein
MGVLPMSLVWAKIHGTFMEARQIYRELGFKAVFRRYGWKLVVGIFLYYLIRDVILYLLIPALVWRSITQ